jgi:hypothetical protein
VLLEVMEHAVKKYIHTYIHTHTYINTHIHTYIHTYTHTYTHTHTYIQTYIHTYVHTFTFTFYSISLGVRNLSRHWWRKSKSHFPKNRAIYELMSTSTAEPEKPKKMLPI